MTGGKTADRIELQPRCFLVLLTEWKEGFLDFVDNIYLQVSQKNIPFLNILRKYYTSIVAERQGVVLCRLVMHMVMLILP